MSAPFIDGSAAGQGSPTSIVTGTLTCVNANNIIVACVSNESVGAAVTVSSITNTGTALAWNTRKVFSAPVNAANDFVTCEIWWGLSTGIFSGTVTANFGGNVDDACIAAFGVHGANLGAPWDPNSSLPATNTNLTATASIPTVTGISTNNANNFIIGFVSEGNGALQTTQTAGTGFTLIQTQDNPGGGNTNQLGTERQGNSTVVSGATVTFGVSWNNWAMVVDAIQGPVPVWFGGAGDFGADPICVSEWIQVPYR